MQYPSNESAVSECPTFALSKIGAFFKITVNVWEINKNRISIYSKCMEKNFVNNWCDRLIGAVGHSAVYYFVVAIE